MLGSTELHCSLSGSPWEVDAFIMALFQSEGTETQGHTEVITEQGLEPWRRSDFIAGLFNRYRASDPRISQPPGKKDVK